MAYKFTVKPENKYNANTGEFERKIIFSFPPMSSSELSTVGSSLRNFLKKKMEISTVQVDVKAYGTIDDDQGHFIVVYAKSLMCNRKLFAYFPSIKQWIKKKSSRFIMDAKIERMQDFQEGLVSLAYMAGGMESLHSQLSDFFTEYGRQKHYDRLIKGEFSDADTPLQEDQIQELASRLAQKIMNKPVSVYQYFNEDQLDEMFNNSWNN